MSQPLITSVASPEETPDHCIKDIVDTIENGLLVVAGGGGGSTKSVLIPHPLTETDPDQSTITRPSPRKLVASKKFDGTARPVIQPAEYATRATTAYIIPYSAKDKKGIDFWKFVELFRGVKATVALKAVALTPNPESVDTMKNVWFLCKVCHDGFGGDHAPL